MPFNISEFHANISKTGGVALSNLFEIEVPGIVGKTNLNLNSSTPIDPFDGPTVSTPVPKGPTKIADAGDVQNMSFRIAAFDTPGRSIVDLPSRDYGPQRRIGSAPTYADVSITIIVSPDLRERQYFLKWQDLIVGNHRKKDLNAEGKRSQFNVGYYNNYVSDGVILKYYAPNSKTPTYTLQLIEAYPFMIANLPLAWSQDDVLLMTVTFAYRYFVDDYDVMDDQQSKRSTGVLERLNQLGIGGGIGTLGGIAAGKLGSRVTTGAFAGASIAGKIF